MAENEKSSANSQLLSMLPAALEVIRDTIDASRKVSKDSLDTSKWLVEKLTGKARTEDEQNNDGLLRIVLAQLQDMKTAQVAASKDKQILVKDDLNKDPKGAIDSFVDQFEGAK